MRSLVVVVPGDLESRTGGYGYDRRIIAGLRTLGWPVAVERLDGSFPHPTAEARRLAAAVLADCPDHALVMVDGLAFGAMPDEAGRERLRLKLVALVHHPLAAETGLDPRVATDLAESERRSLATARLVVVTSLATATALAAYDVPRARIAVVEPGTDPAPLARGSRSLAPQLLCVASVVPRKGYDVLIEALGQLRELPWTLTCVGSLDRHPDTVARVRQMVADRGLGDRVRFEGELGAEGMDAWYRRADLFVLPTRHEGYGMAVAEALARGLPVVSTATGAIPDLVGDAAGVLVEGGNPHALAAALGSFLRDARLRERLAAGARRRRTQLPTWEDAAARMAAALERVYVDG